MPKCCVKGCPTVKGHRFPKDITLAATWLRAVRRETSWVPGAGTVVCSRHFFDRDYAEECATTGLPLVKRRLKKGAVPSIFPWYTDVARIQFASERAKRAHFRGLKPSVLDSCKRRGDSDEFGISYKPEHQTMPEKLGNNESNSENSELTEIFVEPQKKFANHS